MIYRLGGAIAALIYKVLNPREKRIVIVIIGVSRLRQ